MAAAAAAAAAAVPAARALVLVPRPPKDDGECGSLPVACTAPAAACTARYALLLAPRAEPPGDGATIGMDDGVARAEEGVMLPYSVPAAESGAPGAVLAPARVAVWAGCARVSCCTEAPQSRQNCCVGGTAELQS